MVMVRVATLADAPAISAVQRAGWLGAYTGIVDASILDQVTRPDGGARVRETFRARPWQHTMVASAGDDVVGYASFGPERMVAGATWPPPVSPAGAAGEIAELYALYVHPGWWSTGTGRALMEQALARTGTSGYGEIVLWVLEENARARRFYALAGFAPDGAVNILAGLGGVPEVRYRRPLPA